MQTQDTESLWSNGITLKKTRDGYSWTIAIAATDSSDEAMAEAMEKIAKLDKRLRELYGTEVTARLR